MIWGNIFLPGSCPGDERHFSFPVSLRPQKAEYTAIFCDFLHFIDKVSPSQATRLRNSSKSTEKIQSTGWLSGKKTPPYVNLTEVGRRNDAQSSSVITISLSGQTIKDYENGHRSVWCSVNQRFQGIKDPLNSEHR